MQQFYVAMFQLFLIIGLINIIHFGLFIGGANIYDMLQFRRQKSMPNKKRTNKPRPLVSVLIPAHNERFGIIPCLETVRKNSYRKIEIIVVNDASKDETARLVRQYIVEHPKRSIRLVSLRKNVGKAGALNKALKQYAKGDLVMTIDADSILHKDAIKNAVAYFEDEKVVGVAANVRVMDKLTVLGLLQKFEHMIGYRSKKFYSLANCEFIIGGVASTYRRSIMKEVKFYDTDTTTEDIGLSLKIAALGNQQHRLIYASDVVAMTEGVQTFKALLRQRYRWKMGMLQNLIKHKRLLANNNKKYSRMLTYYRVPMAYIGEIIIAIEPFMWIYLLYLTIVFRTPALFIGAYMAITLYVLWTLWPDEHTSGMRKVYLSIYAPILYFIFYIMSFVQIISIFRCLADPKQVARKVKTKGGWISPERSGEVIQFT